MPNFFETRMGQKFYNGTVPELVRQLTRLNDNLEKMIALQTGEKPNPKKESEKNNESQ